MKTKTYTITLTENEDKDKTFNVKRRNDGFNSLELISLLELAQREIIEQISGLMPKPKVVTREIVVDEKEEEK